jgi:hypothetical protein
MSSSVSHIPCLSPASLLWPERLIASGWVAHIPFAFWLVERLRPKTIVELGTHTGLSYSAFCQAAEAADLDCRCHAIDTWQGDAHAGFYANTVFEEFRQYHDSRYSWFSTLHRMPFDEALSLFADGSVDVLHIDGLHTYEAVKHDYESWRPKLSPDAVVLFHDTNVRRDDFGVFRLWTELASQHPSFEFLHGNGLGVLAAGKVVPERLADLFTPANGSEDIAAIRQSYQALGDRLIQALELSHLRSDNQTFTSKLDALTTKINDYVELTQALRAVAHSTSAKAENFASLNTAVSSMAEITVKEFSERQQFMDFATQNPHFFAADELNRVAERIRQNGIYCNVYKEAVSPEAIVIHDDNYRETIAHKGLNSRLRAVHYVLETATAGMPPDDIKLFSPEAVTTYGRFHRAANTKFVGAEYTTDPRVREWLYPIPVEDLHHLSFPDGSFRAAVVNEIFEHLPFLDKALAELARILMPGGKLVSTFPFYGTSQSSVVKARMQGDEIEYLMEPEYHGNPIDSKGSLVFEIPGWEILDRTRAAGFRNATMQWVYSESCGMLAPGYGGIFVLLAEK